MHALASVNPKQDRLLQYSNLNVSVLYTHTTSNNHRTCTPPPRPTAAARMRTGCSGTPHTSAPIAASRPVRCSMSAKHAPAHQCAAAAARGSQRANARASCRSDGHSLGNVDTRIRPKHTSTPHKTTNAHETNLPTIHTVTRVRYRPWY